jgi:nicotinate-nucleotide pyrophosphorylase (carboxylating)
VAEQQKIREFIVQALAEDIGDGDQTSLACIAEQATGHAALLAKEEGIIAGVELASQIFDVVDSGLHCSLLMVDGERIFPGDRILTVSGKARSILKAERLVLNCMQRMSGIATMTRRYADAIEGTDAILLDTRKTTPGFRHFEKWAVRIGGGHNHRFGLYDMMMIKDNHIDYAGSVVKALEAARHYLAHTGKRLKIEVEARTMEEVEEILQSGGADRIMLDNFKPDMLARAVIRIGNLCETEASGNITLTNIRDYALTGVKYISVGALTHSYRSLDLSLKASIHP